MSVTVTKPKASKRCPICNGLFNSSFGHAVLKDGTICGRCARQVRVIYPTVYERHELKRTRSKNVPWNRSGRRWLMWSLKSRT